MKLTPACPRLGRIVAPGCRIVELVAFICLIVVGVPIGVGFPDPGTGRLQDVARVEASRMQPPLAPRPPGEHPADPTAGSTPQPVPIGHWLLFQPDDVLPVVCGLQALAAVLGLLIAVRRPPCVKGG